MNEPKRVKGAGGKYECPGMQPPRTTQESEEQEQHLQEQDTMTAACKGGSYPKD